MADGFARVRNITDSCYGEGKNWESSWQKTPALASTQTIWSDLSTAPGNPKPNYYVGAELAATRMGGSDANGAYLISSQGIYHGGDVSPNSKHLHKVLIGARSATLIPAKFYLLDYLLFYPLVDMDSTDTQTLINTATLPRYTTGAGVQAFLVATNPYIGGAKFFITYVNQDGAERNSVVEVSNTSTFIGSLLHSGTAGTSGGPFIRLFGRDTGVRSITSITFLSSNGGLAALVLAKPLAVLSVPEITAYCEWDFLAMKPTLPRIYDGAYLNMLICPNGSMATIPINGSLSVIWN